MIGGHRDGALGPYRILDLSDKTAPLCGKVLADLGAEVIKVEVPGGDPARNLGPFWKDEPHPEKSLYWFAFNSGKKSITLDIRQPNGKRIFEMLAKYSDIIIETHPPGYLSKLGLGYEGMKAINPLLILTSITPFGQTGPYRNHKGSDLVNMAMGGYTYICGDPDRPPVRVTVEQSYPMAGIQAAMGTLLALRHRNLTGQGQMVDVSIQECLPCCTTIEIAFWQAEKYIAKRTGIRRRRGINYARDLWPCKDGYIGWRLLGGELGSATMRGLITWMENEGVSSDLKNIDWEKIDMTSISQEEMERWEENIISFLLTHTKAEIYDMALKKRMLMCPEFDSEELVKYTQLRDRNFWVEVDYSHLAARLVQPGEFCKMKTTPLVKGMPAPRIGEHNTEIYTGLLKIPSEELTKLHKQGVV